MGLNEGGFALGVGTGGWRGLAGVGVKEECPVFGGMCCRGVAAEMGVCGWRIPAVVGLSQ